MTVRIADAKTAIIVETFPAKGEVIKDKVELKGNNGSGGDDFRATVMDAATFDAANRVAARLESWVGSSGAATPTTSGETPGGAKVEPPKPASPNSSRGTPSATPPTSSSSSTASLPASPPPPATDKVGLVSQVSGNRVLIAVEQPGRVKVGDRLWIKRIAKAIPDPYNPGRYLGYDFTPIGSVTITAIVNERVVRGTFSGGGRKGRVAPTPKFQDWVISAP